MQRWYSEISHKECCKDQRGESAGLLLVKVTEANLHQVGDNDGCDYSVPIRMDRF